MYVQVRLKDSLVSSVHFSRAKEAELAWIDGQIHLRSATSKAVMGEGGGEREGGGESKEKDLVPVLDALPQSQVGHHGYCAHRKLCY